MINLILKQPIAFLGALGLIGMLKGVITLNRDVLYVVHAYQYVTQPVWDFILGWMFNLLEISFPTWMKDYLTFGCIFCAARIHAIENKTLLKKKWYKVVFEWARLIVLFAVLWPIPFFERVSFTIFFIYIQFRGRQSDNDVKKFLVENQSEIRHSIKADKELKEVIGGLVDLTEENLKNKRESVKIKNNLIMLWSYILWALIIISYSYGALYLP